MHRSVAKTLLAIGAWAILHSLLATTRSKQAAARRLGPRHTDAFYRLGFNAVAAATTTGLALYIHHLPDRDLYHARGPARLALNLLRAALILVMIRAVREIGIGPFSGFSEARALLTNRPTFPAPEAQGPAGYPDLQTGGPFRYVRHPLNAAAAAVVLLTPRMTVVRLAVALATVAYAILGSLREESRLFDMYGERYRQYQRSGVPFFLPRLRPLP